MIETGKEQDRAAFQRIKKTLELKKEKPNVLLGTTIFNVSTGTVLDALNIFCNSVRYFSR